ncbi:unnamed protein product, partial [Medioppia subpectinata]
INTYSLHPGAVNTDVGRHMGMSAISEKVARTVSLTPELGAQTSLHCILTEGLDGESGFYYSNCERVDKMVPTATDEKMSQALWELSCELVNLEPHLRIPVHKTNAW